LLAAVAHLLGWELHGWQQHAADVSLEYDPISRTPAYGIVGISVARQNGKTTLVCARIAMQLIVPNATVVYTAQDRNLARFKWQEHVDLLMATPFAARVSRVDRVNGREMLLMDNGARYLIVTPGDKAGRSLSIDLGVVDEAFAHESLSVVGAIQGAMSARRHAQLWLLSNAGTVRSGLWRHYTDLGRGSVDNPSTRLCWQEWAADDTTGIDVHDRAAWAQANPTLDLPHGVSSVQLAGNADTQDISTFAREHLNIWPDMSLVLGIDPLTWAACTDTDAIVSTGLSLSLDFTPERDRGAVVVAGPYGDRCALDVIETSNDVHELARRAVDVAARWNATVVLDRANPASTLLPLFERAGVTVRLLSLPDFVRACGDFHDAVVHHTIAHRGDYRLTDAVASATKRGVGDGWVWKRRGAGDVTPLVAATLARWGLVGAPVDLVPTVF
jgi:phage terminase large subunit-like protein